MKNFQREMFSALSNMETPFPLSEKVKSQIAIQDRILEVAKGLSLYQDVINDLPFVPTTFAISAEWLGESNSVSFEYEAYNGRVGVECLGGKLISFDEYAMENVQSALKDLGFGEVYDCAERSTYRAWLQQ